MRVLSIIFDLDGTLLDTLGTLASCANYVMNQRGWQSYLEQDYKTLIGGGLKELMRRMLPTHVDESEIELCCQLFLAKYKKSWKEGCAPYPGIREMLDSLVKANIPISILSNKPHDFTALFVQEFLSGYPFHPIVGQRPGIPTKPDPGAALAIVKKLDCSPEDVLFVGDSDVDILTGKNAQMMTAGVTWGFRPEEELRQSGADLIIHNPLEIVEYVCNTPRNS